MVRGMLLFYCSECRHRFMGMDVEWNATAFSAPLECPQCGSWHTRPWSLLPAKIADARYKSIWQINDRSKN